jgi:hypothetical protein
MVEAAPHLTDILRSIWYNNLCWIAKCNASKEEISFLLQPGSATGKDRERTK